MKFIVRFQQFSMHHIYNDIFHQAAVSQSLSKIRINIISFMSTSYTRGPGGPSDDAFQHNLEEQWANVEGGKLMIKINALEVVGVTGKCFPPLCVVLWRSRRGLGSHNKKPNHHLCSVSAQAYTAMHAKIINDLIYPVKKTKEMYNCSWHQACVFCNISGNLGVLFLYKEDLCCNKWYWRLHQYLL